MRLSIAANPLRGWLAAGRKREGMLVDHPVTLSS